MYFIENHLNVSLIVRMSTPQHSHQSFLYFRGIFLVSLNFTQKSDQFFRSFQLFHTFTNLLHHFDYYLNISSSSIAILFAFGRICYTFQQHRISDLSTNQMALEIYDGKRGGGEEIPRPAGNLQLLFIFFIVVVSFFKR